MTRDEPGGTFMLPPLALGIRTIMSDRPAPNDEPSLNRITVLRRPYYASASRVFALILDDLHVDARRTQVVRAAARRLVEQLTPPDLLFVVMTSSAESTGYFTRDRRQAVEMIERFGGRRLPDKTMATAKFKGHDFEPERLDHYQRLCATIRNVSLAFRDVSSTRVTAARNCGFSSR